MTSGGSVDPQRDRFAQRIDEAVATHGQVHGELVGGCFGLWMIPPNSLNAYLQAHLQVGTFGLAVASAAVAVMLFF